MTLVVFPSLPRCILYPLQCFQSSELTCTDCPIPSLLPSASSWIWPMGALQEICRQDQSEGRAAAVKVTSQTDLCSGSFSLLLPASRVAVANVKKVTGMSLSDYVEAKPQEREMPYFFRNLIFILCFHFAENIHIWFKSNWSTFIFLGFGSNSGSYKFGS